MKNNPKQWERVKWHEAKQIPCAPGCYALLDDNENILYIGRSKLLWNRLRNPKLHSGFKRKEISDEKVFIAWCCGWEVYELEKELITTWQPPLSLA